jgi:hypothetical protein
MTKRQGQKRRRGGLDILDLDFFGGFDDGAGLILGVLLLAIVVTIVLVVAGAPLLVFALEGTVFLGATAWGLVVRQIGRHPWTVQARTDGPPPSEVRFECVGWRASARLGSRLARRLSMGDDSSLIRFPEIPRAARKS